MICFELKCGSQLILTCPICSLPLHLSHGPNWLLYDAELYNARFPPTYPKLILTTFGSMFSGLPAAQTISSSPPDTGVTIRREKIERLSNST